MIRLENRDTLIEDLVRALENSSGGTSALVEFANNEVGFAILQLASGRAAFDDAFKPDDVRSVNGQRLTLRAIAARFVSEKMLRATNTHYAVLGLAKHCHDAAINTHFRRLISIVHPDANPVGYPADAAIQVNLANALLTAPDRRAAYNETLAAPPAPPLTVRSASRPPTASPAERGGGGLRAATRLMRARSSLIWGAGALTLAVLYIASSFLREPTRTELIVAKPNIKSATEPNTSLSSAVISAANDPIIALSSDKRSGNLTVTTNPDVITPYASVDAQRSVSAATTVVEPSAAAEQRVTPRTPPSGGDTVALSISRELSSLSNRPALIASVSSVRRNSAPLQASPDDASDAPAQPLDRRASDEFLATFADAIEIGQSERFARLFGRDVAGRSDVLRGFEQLFQSTQKRQIRYVRIDQFRDKRGLWAFSGQADLSTLSRDGASGNHRLFVSGTLVQRDGQVQLASWTSHPISAQ